MKTDSSGKEQIRKSIQADPLYYDFGAADLGYEPVDPVRFVIRNTGSQPARNLIVAMEDEGAEKYWLCLAHTADSLGCAGSDDSETCFYVYPWDRLGGGTHTAGLHIQADGMSPVRVRLSFTVCPEKSASASRPR